MKFFMRRFVLVASLLFSSLHVSRSLAADTTPPPRLTVELRDGSRVIGSSEKQTFKFHSELLGELKLPVKAINSVECVTSNSAKLTLVNGDTMAVTFDASSIGVKTGFGEVELPVASIRQLDVSAVGSPAVHRPGLVALWPGNGNANDLVGGIKGTLTGSAGYGPGKTGQAFVFSADGDAVQLDNPSALELQNFTIKAWIKRASTTASSFNYRDADILAFGRGGYGFGVNYDGTLFLTRVNFDNVTANTTVTDTNWHHVAVTRDGSNVIFYVDGVAYPVPPYDSRFEFNTGVCIGARGTDLWNTFYGSICGVSVYNRALSADEVREDYEAGSQN